MYQFDNVFVRTKNARNFEVMMDALALGEGEGRIGMVYSQAGRGKTRTTQRYAAHNDCIYMQCMTVWRNNETDFLRQLCRELHILEPPKRKGALFESALNVLLSNPRPVFLDEIDKLHKGFLDIVRDLSDVSTAPFVMIGEENLVGMMKNNRRIWSRTFQQLEFGPIGVTDAIIYAKESARMVISPQVAQIILKESGNDLRLVKRAVLVLVHNANAMQTTEINEDMARAAVKSGLHGKD